MTTTKRPTFLYHASQNKDIKIFEPRAESVRDINEGPVVFATPDKVMASVFIVSTNDTWANSGLFGSVHYFVCGNENKFRNIDKGGAIYTLPANTFQNDPSKGLGTREWTSKISVEPIKIELYESGLEAMIDMGVQVYFVSQEKFEDIQRSQDHGNEILRNSISENQKRNKNVKKIPAVSRD